MNKKNIAKQGIIMLIIIALILPLASATIDLVTPEDNTYTNQANQDFEFYLGMENATSCTLFIDSAEAARLESPIPSEFNTINATIGNGEHTWMIECQAENLTEQSEQRSITLDTVKPTIVLFNPANNTTFNSSTAELIFVALDNLAESISCELMIDGSIIQQITANNSQPATITATGLAEGAHTWQVACTDTASNTENSETRSFTVAATPEPPEFSISIAKSEMKIGENTLMSISAPNGTSIRIEVCPNSSGFVECKVPVIGDNIMNYPFQEYLPFTNYEGRYIIEAFFNKSGTTETKTIGYTVKNDISISIDVSDNPRKNNPVVLEAKAKGGVGKLNYTWTLSNGNKINSKEANITYSSEGTYTNTISVKDEYNNTMNKSVTIEVINAYRAEIIVKDNRTGAPISYATVEIDDEQKDTDANGKAEYYLEPRGQDILVLKENYTIYNGELSITKDESFTISLEPIIKAVPAITLIRPENNSGITGITTDLVFKAEHSAPLNCSFYINEQNDGFFIYLGSMAVESSDEKIFGITALEEKTYWWKVECQDQQKNTGTSNTWQFRVGTGAAEAQVATQQAIAGEGYSAWIREYEQVLGELERLPKEEKEAALALNIREMVEGTIQSFQDTVRDLDSLNFRKDLTDEQKQAEAERLVAEAEKTYQKGPVNIILLESDNYVDYIRKEELQALAEEYLETGQLESEMEGEIDNEALSEYLDALQQEVVISTKLRTARINFRDGTSQDISIVIREIKAYELPQGAFIIEVVPKEVAQDASEIKSLQNFKVLKQDPIIRFEISGDTTITYYFENSIPKEMLRKIKTAVMIDLESLSDDQLTGFAVKRFKMPSAKGIVYIPFIIILLGGLALAGFRYGGVDTARYALYRVRRNKSLHYISVILNEIHDNLSIGDVNKAASLYEEARGAYQGLSNLAKNDIHEHVADAASKISNYYDVMSMTSSVDDISSMISNIQGLLQDSQIIAALEEYKRIESAYHGLDEQTQELLHPTLVALGNNIQIAIENMKDNV